MAKILYVIFILDVIDVHIVKNIYESNRGGLLAVIMSNAATLYLPVVLGEMR